MKTVFTILNGITMYRLMLYFLSILLCVSIFLSAFGILPYNPLDIFLQAILFPLFCWLINTLISRLLNAKPNTESSIITGLILASIVGPIFLPNEWLVFFIIATTAIASKYIFAIHKSHIFNPAAFGVLSSAVFIGYPASWWIGSAVMFPIIILGGALVLIKIRRLHLVFSFLIAYFGLLSINNLFIQNNAFNDFIFLLKNLLIVSPILFFSFVMLVEPLTSPQTKTKRVLFGALVGSSLFFFQRFSAPIPFSLELSLIVGNAFSRLLNPDFRQSFILRKKEVSTPDVINFWFEPTRAFGFLPGQFLEYTLPHPRADSRGLRRYFTIASSPTEKQILLTTKFSNPGSTFKQALHKINLGNEIIASKVAGEFVLSPDKNEKYVFIAGGIGITPFRSIVKYLIDTNQKRNIVLLYGAKQENDLVFRDIFEEANKKFGMKNIFVLSDITNFSNSWSGKKGFIDETLIKESVPDLEERTFYVSGPEPMVEAMEKTLNKIGIPNKSIKRDYFPGYE